MPGPVSTPSSCCSTRLELHVVAVQRGLRHPLQAAGHLRLRPHPRLGSARRRVLMVGVADQVVGHVAGLVHGLPDGEYLVDDRRPVDGLRLGCAVQLSQAGVVVEELLGRAIPGRLLQPPQEVPQHSAPVHRCGQHSQHDVSDVGVQVVVGCRFGARVSPATGARCWPVWVGRVDAAEVGAHGCGDPVPQPGPVLCGGRHGRRDGRQRRTNLVPQLTARTPEVRGEVVVPGDAAMQGGQQVLGPIQQVDGGRVVHGQLQVGCGRVRGGPAAAWFRQAAAVLAVMRGG